MNYKNGFFQLDIRPNGVYAHIYPEKDGGKKIVIQEFSEYLEKCGIHNYNLSELNKQISQVTEECDVFVSSEQIGEVGEKAKVRITDDKMVAIIRFYPPSLKGKRMTERDILNELTGAGIKYGISPKIIKAFMAGPQYCRDIPIAKGKEMVRGCDAKVEYFFNAKPTAKPKLLEDGSVDFHELNLFTTVKSGDLLAQLTKEQLGEPGINVIGNKVLPPKVRSKALRFGHNIRITEDGLQIYSEVDGDVRLEGDMVFVSNNYLVPADVDNSTGDIHYDGNVTVTGNVRSGFTVEASGDIEVNGIVEGATLIAGGNIVLKRGVQGMSKATLQAGNDIVSKFFESCTVIAGHGVNTGSSLHSDVTAGEYVVVSGKKGFLIGGTIQAGNKIEACVIGNKMNTLTNLKVGVPPEVMDRFKELSLSIKQNQDDMMKSQQIIDTIKKKSQEGQKILPNQIALVKQAGEDLKTISANLEVEFEEYVKLKAEIEQNKNGKVIADQIIYAGVYIYISNRVFPVKDNRSRCQFIVSDADVVSVPI